MRPVRALAHVDTLDLDDHGGPGMPTRRLPLALASGALLAAAPADGQNLQEIRRVLGREGSVDQGTLGITFPRTDLEVALAGLEVSPEIFANSWLGFLPMEGGRTMLMGDVVVRVPEIQPAMGDSERQGLEVTALHNHRIGTEPTVMFIHPRDAEGAVLARKVRAVLARTAAPLAGAEEEERPTRDWPDVRRILDAEGEAEGRVIEFVFPRTDRLTMHGQRMPSTEALEIASELALQDLGGGRALAVGESIAPETEANPVMRTLQEGGFSATALHNHNTDGGATALVRARLKGGSGGRARARCRSAARAHRRPARRGKPTTWTTAAEAGSSVRAGQPAAPGLPRGAGGR